ncbi:MAG: hypothetical protein WC133_04345 [Candidatus Omnitrophota bacterium]
MQKLSDKKITIISRSGQSVSGPVASKKKLNFFGFFDSPRTETHGKNTTTAFKEPALKTPPLNVPRANLAAVRNWVALEEKIVHDYKEQKTAPLKSPVPFSKTPGKQLYPAFETFSTQTAVSAAPRISRLKDPLRDSGKTFSGSGKFFLSVGLVAGVFVFLYVQGIYQDRAASQMLAQLQSEKEQLGRSYAALKNASEEQSAEMKGMDSRFQDMVLELKTAKADKIAYEQGLEKKYREELMRITVRYESELAALRGTVETQQSIVNALKAQSRAFDKIVDQAGMSALSGAAAGLSREPFSTGRGSLSQGEVTSVNGKQGSVVINRGADQGVRSRSWITIFRNGIGLAVGRIDRVYPTMSVAVVRDAAMLQVIQEGDTVAFAS